MCTHHSISLSGPSPPTMEEIIAQLDSPSNINKFIESSIQSFDQDEQKITQFCLELSKVFAPMHSHLEDWNEIRAQDQCLQREYIEFPIVFLANMLLLSASRQNLSIVRLLVAKFKIFFSTSSSHAANTSSFIRKLTEKCIIIGSDSDIWLDFVAICSELDFKGNEECFELLMSFASSSTQVGKDVELLERLLQQWMQNETISIGFIEKNISFIPFSLWKFILPRSSMISEVIFEHLKGKCTDSIEMINLMFRYLPWESHWKEHFVLFSLQKSLHGSLVFWFALLANYKSLEKWIQELLLECMIQGAKVTNDAWKSSLAVHFLSIYHRKPISQLPTSEQQSSAMKKTIPLKNKLPIPDWMHQLMLRNANALGNVFPSADQLPYSQDSLSSLYWSLDSFLRFSAHSSSFSNSNHKIDENSISKSLAVLEHEFDSNSAFHWLIIYKWKSVICKRPSLVPKSTSSMINAKVREFLEIVTVASSCYKSSLAPNEQEQENSNSKVHQLALKVVPLTRLFVLDMAAMLPSDEEIVESVKMKIASSPGFAKKLRRLLGEPIESNE